MTLEEFFKKYNKVALAFSGGTDSSLLLYMAKKYNANVSAYFVKSQFQPQFELEDAFEVANFVGTEITVIQLDVLKNEVISSNPKDRCYHCKREIFGSLSSRAKDDGFDFIIDGTNASDDENDRPGMKALKELQVLSPLKLCGITKTQVREMSKIAKLPTADKKSYSCLATRVPNDVKIDEVMLDKIERAEKFLANLSFTNFRVRYNGKLAKIQVEECQMENIFKNRQNISEHFSKLFEDYVLDLKPREKGE